MGCFLDQAMKFRDVSVVSVIQELIVVVLVGEESDDLLIKG